MSGLNFSQIPVTVLTPGVFVEFDTSRMLNGLPVPKTRTLITGQKLASGTMAANTLTRCVSANQGKQLAGQGSQLADMIDGYFKNDTTTDVFIVGLADNGAGVAQTYTITAAGTATAAGVLDLMIQDQRVQVAAPSGMTAAQAATALNAAIALYPDLCYTAGVSGAVVTLTCRHKGADTAITIIQNYHSEDAAVPGLVLTIAAGTAGTTNPDATAVFTAIGDAPFAAIVHPWTDATNLSAIETACKARADAMMMNYSEAYTFKADTYGNLITLASGRNSEFQPIAGMYGSPTPPWKLAAMVAARVVWWSRNNLGCPFTGQVLQGALPPRVADRFDRTERELLLEAGLSTLKLDATGAVVIERMVTTRKTNAQGFADAGLRSLNAILLLYYLSWSLQARITARFPAYKLGADGGNYGPDARVVTPKQIKGEHIALATDWAQAGLIENLDDYIASIDVQRDRTNVDRVNSIQRPDLINEFNVLAALVQPIA